MGADKHAYPQKKPNAPFHLRLIIVAFVGIALAIPTIWNALSPMEEKKLQNRLREIDDAEQYALIASQDGWYPCNHIGRPVFYLKTGEVWKYGTTTKGQTGRYTVKFLENRHLVYLIQYKGTISECLKEEQMKLYYYPFLPENLARPEQDRLPRPPYNSKMQ